MKRKHMQTVMKTKYVDNDGLAKVYRQLDGAISLIAMELWVENMKNAGAINLSFSVDCSRTI